jgi:hypothetical protein
MRGLKIATIAMGVLILLGTTVIVVTIVRRTMTGPVGVAERPFTAVLDEPAGTTIAGITAVRDRLALRLRGGGADRVVLVDPTSGTLAGRIELTH